MLLEATAIRPMSEGLEKVSEKHTIMKTRHNFSILCGVLEF